MQGGAEPGDKVVDLGFREGLIDQPVAQAFHRQQGGLHTRSTGRGGIALVHGRALLDQSIAVDSAETPLRVCLPHGRQ
jgi:hypothetical protein